MILRAYDPPECDEHGVPLDYDACRVCGATGRIITEGEDRGPCQRCGGHGSLKAAALAARASINHGHLLDALPTVKIRCEDCGHPMSEGTWEGYPAGSEVLIMRGAYEVLRNGWEPWSDGSKTVHYSPCDEGCRHGGPMRWDDGTQIPDTRLTAQSLIGAVRDAHPEASWRQVDVRMLGWPHDLRPEKLSVFCLRCWAERSQA